MLNSAGHPDGKQAMEMVVGDAIKAHERGVPVELVKLALDQVEEWRSILLETQPRIDEKVVGTISLEELEQELQGKLPQDYLIQLFSEEE